jgi:hypothetical protein
MRDGRKRLSEGVAKWLCGYVAGCGAENLNPKSIIPNPKFP